MSGVLDSAIPVWDKASAETQEVMSRCPSVLVSALLEYLICCTPSFPAAWAELPVEEQTAALSLTQGGLPAFRDTAKPAWSARMTFTVVVDLDADFETIRNDADRWLAAKKNIHDRERRRCGELQGDPNQGTKAHNPGRRAAPRPEALSWLGSYRFHQAGVLSFGKAKGELDRRSQDLKDPTCPQYPKLYTPQMDETLWARWNRKAEAVMAGMLKGRIFTPPGSLLPWPRWQP